MPISRPRAGEYSHLTLSTGCLNIHTIIGHASSSESSHRLTNKQKRFIRKLVHVLVEIIDEKSHFQTDDDDSSIIAEESSSEDETQIEVDQSKQRVINYLKKSSKFVLKNLASLSRFLEKHNELTFQIRAMLNTLGGGDRTAKALEKMHESLNMVIRYCTSRDHEDNRIRLYPNKCVEALLAFSGTFEEMIAAFQDFGVFGTKFFDELMCLALKSREIALKLDSEYGQSDREMAKQVDMKLPPALREYASGGSCIVDEYLDSLFEPLVAHLETYIHELASISNREITAVRRSQESASQQYLNLPTIATFLSSVTATTLQISTAGPVSTLATVTNSIWFVSLVCSSASIVYSLLDMSWRRSSIRRPELSLPWLAHAWLREGPMFALIAALVTFSIGLCLLAFLVTDQQGGITPAVVPTTLAGLHAYAMLFLSAWYLFEHWKARNSESWMRVRDKYLLNTAQSIRERAEQTKQHGFRIKQLVRELAAVLKRTVLCFKLSASETRPFSEVELGRRFPNSNVNNSTSATYISVQSCSEQRAGLTSAPRNGLGLPKAVSLTTKPSSLSPGESSQYSSEARTSHYEDCFSFRPIADYWLHSGSVTFYDVNNSFTVLDTFVVPDGGQIRQIAWYPRESEVPHSGEEQEENLLVRSSKGISTWAVLIRKVISFVAATVLVLIVLPRRGITSIPFSGFSCLLGTSVAAFVRQHLQGVSYFDILITDKVICLARMQSSTDQRSQLYVIDRTTKAVELKYTMYSHHTRLTVSRSTSQILVHGGEGETEIVELQDPAGTDDHYALRRIMIFNVTDKEIGIFYRPLERQKYCSPLHVITTPTPKALAKDPTSFAVGLHPDQTFPYLFAFGDKDGSVMIWSVQSNRALANCNAAEEFEVHDRREGRYHPVVTMGKFLTLPPPMNPTGTHFGSEYESAVVS
ncbi:hypothetical protein ACEPAF_7862 [Sanghuangporus sanghuang]